MLGPSHFNKEKYAAVDIVVWQKAVTFKRSSSVCVEEYIASLQPLLLISQPWLLSKIDFIFTATVSQNSTWKKKGSSKITIEYYPIFCLNETQNTGKKNLLPYRLSVVKKIKNLFSYIICHTWKLLGRMEVRNTFSLDSWAASFKTFKEDFFPLLSGKKANWVLF